MKCLPVNSQGVKIQQDCQFASASALPAPSVGTSLSDLAIMNLNGGQDWDTVVIRKKAPTTSQMKDEAAVNAARRSGAQVETVKKFTAGQNKAGPTTSSGKSAVKLEQETEDFHHEKVSTELKKQIIQARTAKKLTQSQLAQLVNEKPQIIQEYESGKAIPNPQVLSKLSRVLGVTLRKNPTK
eukprot:jgi/Chrzof1/1482/Cz10g09150.t1